MALTPDQRRHMAAAIDTSLELLEDGDRSTARSVLAAALMALPDGKDRRQRARVRPFEDQLAEVRDAVRALSLETLSERLRADSVAETPADSPQPPEPPSWKRTANSGPDITQGWGGGDELSS